MCLSVLPSRHPSLRSLPILAFALWVAAVPAWAQEGREALDKATELQLSAQSTDDLEEVAQLCEKALKAGLPEADQGFAKQLASSALLQVSERLAAGALNPQPHPRWPLLRQAALQRLERALEYSPELGEAHLLVVKLHMLPDGDRDRALKAANGAVDAFAKERSDLVESLLLRAKLQMEAKDRLADIERVIELDGKNTEAWRTLAAHYFAEDKPEEALKAFRKVIEIDPDNVTARLALAETLASMDRADEAQAEIDKVIKDHPDAAQAFLVRGQLLTSQEKYDEAIDALSQAIKLDRDNFRALLFRAELRLVTDDLKGARRDADAVLRASPGLVAGYLMRARIRAADDDATGAIEDLELVIENSRNPPSDWVMQLAAYYSMDEQPRKAIRLMGKVIDAEPENWQALRTRGDTLLSIGKHKEAVADYEAALKLANEESGLLNNLAWVLSTSPMDDVRDGERAIKLATKACELTDYKEAHILSTLASGYAETGDFETAKKWSAKAVERGEGEMKEQLEQELKSYQEGKPWRELQEQKEKIQTPPGGLLET